VTGRGTWTPIGGTEAATIGGHTYGYYRLIDPKVGSQAKTDPTLDPKSTDYRAVSYGVAALQTVLKNNRYGKLSVTGIFDEKTDAAVKNAQQKLGLTNLTPGRVGPSLAKALFKVRINLEQKARGIPNNYLAGILDLESGFDPGAVGSAEFDKGLAQFWCDGTNTWWNSYFGLPEEPVVAEKAFDFIWATQQAGRRFKYYWDKFDGKGEDLQIKCSIAQHNAPGHAETWYKNGVAPTNFIQTYVNAVLDRSSKF
jgi:peptidoglycan hydrolase-like protein with peptidoglycan-binding domain